jgi:hypothetical protein
MKVGGSQGISEYIQVYKRIDHLPKKRQGVKYIVPLFILDAVQRFAQHPDCPELYRDRDDLVSPGKKVFVDGGKLLYADGLKAGTAVEFD